jgi:hypothetical protein
LYFYAFPPFCVILRTLKKIIHDKAQGTLVVPYWPSQPWFPLLEKLTTDRIILEPSTGVYDVSPQAFRRQPFRRWAVPLLIFF